MSNAVATGFESRQRQDLQEDQNFRLGVETCPQLAKLFRERKLFSVSHLIKF